jgi:hypothetical protein
LSFVTVKGLPQSHRRWETKSVGFDLYGITVKGQHIRTPAPQTKQELEIETYCVIRDYHFNLV